MKNISVIVAAVGAALASPAVAGPIITSVQIKNIDGIAGQGWLQIAELELFGGATNYALTGIASATSVYYQGGTPTAFPKFAKDGNTDGTYSYDPNSTVNIYHGAANDGSDVFTLTLAAPTAINTISIYGRPGFQSRDIYSYMLFDDGAIVGTGTLDARNNASFATAALPEPATWAMMLLGFGLIGFGLRAGRGKQAVRVTYA